jgi:IS30 family transposase
MIHHHSKLKPYERGRIALLIAKGFSLRNIARSLNRSVSTISDEVKRNSIWEAGVLVYEAISAQEDYQKRKSKAGKRAPLKNKQVYRYVIEKLRDSWSPEQISGRLKRDHPSNKSWWISYEAIY